MGDGGENIIRVPTLSHRTWSEASCPGKWFRSNYWLSGDSYKAVAFDPAVGWEIDSPVPKVIIKALIKRSVRKSFCPIIGLGTGISFLGSPFTNGIKVPPEVPLAKTSGAIAFIFEHFGDSKIIGFKDGTAKGSNYSVKSTPVVLPGKQGKAARCANA